MAAAAPARKGPPPFVPYIIWVFLPLFYSVTVGPLIASNAYPNDYTSRLRVLVTSFDNSSIGAQFAAVFAAATAPGLPGYEVVVAASTSPAALKAAVVDADDVWGALWMNAGTEAALTQALLNPGANSYSPSSAITFCWNEGRSQNSGRVSGPTRNILHGFELVAATSITNTLSNSSTGLAAVAAAQPSLLTRPIGYSEDIIAPSAQLPYFFVGATIGQILIAVLSLAVTNVVLGALAPFYMKFSPAKVTLIRFALIFIYTAGVAAAFATIMVGLGVNMGSIATSGSGVMWARLWSIQWLQMVIYVVYLGFWAMAFGPAAVPLFLLPMIVYNALGELHRLARHGALSALRSILLHRSGAFSLLVSTAHRCHCLCLLRHVPRSRYRWLPLPSLTPFRLLQAGGTRTWRPLATASSGTHPCTTLPSSCGRPFSVCTFAWASSWQPCSRGWSSSLWPSQSFHSCA